MTNKSKMRTINDKGRQKKDGVEARNQLENFCYQVKNMAGERLSDKTNSDDKAENDRRRRRALSGLTLARTC